MDVRRMESWVSRLLDADDRFSGIGLKDYARAIPRIDALNLSKGAPVLVRCDVDVKIVEGRVRDDARLRSAMETLNHCIGRGWKTVIFGHIGRDPELSLGPVAERFSELLGKDVKFVEDWTDGEAVKAGVYRAVSRAGAGDVLLLENTRRHDIERALWYPEKRTKETVERFLSMARGFRRMGKAFVNEAIASSGRDMSSCIVPAAMDRVALGFFYHRELEQHLVGASDADMVIFSGLKMDKLDDLLGVVRRGKVKSVITAGALAMALKKAHARMEGKDFCIGKAETEEGEEYYISPERVEQAMNILSLGRSKGVRFVVPQDFVLDDGSVSESIPAGKAQLDIGPRTREAVREELNRFLRGSGNGPGRPVVFHNGVFGKFEEPAFGEGTRWFMEQLRLLKEGGARVYVGGGEGAEALRKYGDESWVNHAFSCGGTVLTAMAGEPIPPLKALAMRCGQS
jgi:3-phosphoglycerate kinase